MRRTGAALAWRTKTRGATSSDALPGGAAPVDRKGYGALGFEGFHHRDQFPTRPKSAPERTVDRQMEKLDMAGALMDMRRGWGRGTAMSMGQEMRANQHRNVGDPHGNQNAGEGDAWRMHWGQALVDQAGEEGLELWKKEHQAELGYHEEERQARYPKAYNRTDFPAWMHWTVPPKRVRLEHYFLEKERKFRKTPEFDLTPFQKEIVQKMGELLERAIMFNPLPFKGSRENFAITHLECLRWNSKELWIVCWKLVLDESQRARYEQMLRGSIGARWGAHVRELWGPFGAKMLVPIFHFVYDDGSIPFKRSIVEENMIRARRGQAPLPMTHANPEHWAFNLTRDEVLGAPNEASTSTSSASAPYDSPFVRAAKAGL